MISISKNDFMVTIKDNLKRQWETNAVKIKNSPYFKHLSSMELNKCSTVSFIKTFTQYERVFGEYHKIFEIIIDQFNLKCT